MEKNSNVAVFGASGLVGSAIVRALHNKGYTHITGTYNNRKPDDTSAEYVQVDCTKQHEVETFYEHYRPEYVFLAAAKVGGIVANNTYKADFIYDNIAIATHIIHGAYIYGTQKLLNLGSSCIYPKFAPQPMKEEYLLEGELEPTNEPYAIAKIAAIKLCRYFNEQYKTQFMSVMPTNLYGPNDNFNLETSHVLPALIRKFHLAKLLHENNWDMVLYDLKKYPIGFGLDSTIDYSNKENITNILKSAGTSSTVVTLWGTGNVYREFMHVDDLADACIYLMEHIDAEKMKNFSNDYFVNIGLGKDILLKDLAVLIKEIVGFKGHIEYEAEKPDGTPRKLLDVTKLHNLGWRHSLELEHGIASVYRWYAGSDVERKT